MWHRGPALADLRPHVRARGPGLGAAGAAGCIEARRCWAIDDPDYRRYIDPDRARPGLRSLVMVKAEQRLEGRTTTETRYLLSSLPAQDKRLSQAASLGHEELAALGPGHSLPRGRVASAPALWCTHGPAASGLAGLERSGRRAQTGWMGPLVPPTTAHLHKMDVIALPSTGTVSLLVILSFRSLSTG